MDARHGAVIILVMLLAVPGAEAAAMTLRAEYAVKTGLETRERDRLALDGMGQRNCLDLPASAEAPARAGCEFVSTGVAYPPTGIRVLDAVLFGVGVSDPVGSAKAVAANPTGNVTAPVKDANRGMSAHRATDGDAPEVILPGRSQLWAWHGRWNDLDDDGDVDVAIWNGGTRPRNEWAVDVNTPLVAYVEPGSHPSFTNFHRPDAYAPDLYLVYESDDLAHASGGDAGLRVSGPTKAGIPYSVMVTGSLFEAITVATVSDPIFAPSPGGKPYTPRSTSLVDIDRYAVGAPGPLVQLYNGALASALAPYTTPSLGYCPNACRPGPMSFADTPLEGPAHAAMAGLFAPYPKEWLEGSLSTNAGRQEAYRAGYTDWIDLHPRWSPVGGGLATRSSPLAGRAADGGQAMMPGVLTVEIRLGLWSDLDADGFVGSARAGDPYHGGSRPIADDYEDTRGEFYGTFAVAPGGRTALATISVDLVPDTVWGDGVVPINMNGVPEMPVEGSQPIRIAAARDESAPGYYSAWSGVLMVHGSPAFTICTSDIEMLRALGANEERIPLKDCDRIGAWDGRP
ncbi:MAG TPA: hypothetical protein VM889_03510 [Candidatus Thermoplasmatota archaeon]|nr:hypothetical protein [Candidatus Thermoplasmatota archaeon]